MMFSNNENLVCRIGRRCVWFALLCLVSQGITTSIGFAQQTGVEGTENTAGDVDLKFRRVFAPADQIDSWPRGAEPYVPVNREEFERLIEVAETMQRGVKGALAPRITAAEYDCRLTDDLMVAGTGRLHIEHPGQETSLLVLDSCRIAISDARWLDNDKEVRMGLDYRGRWVVVVPESGTLVLEWSRRVSEIGPEVYRLPLELPRGPMATMKFELPALFDLSGEAVSLTRTDPPPASDDAVWECAFGSTDEAALIFRKRASNVVQDNAASVDQVLSYQVTPEGLALNCELTLDTGNQSLARLELELDAPLQLASATIDQTGIRWSTPENDELVNRLTLEFNEPINGETQIQLLALAPIQRDRLAQFPRIRPRSLAWRHGVIRVAALSSLVIDDLETHGCRQIKSEADTDGQQFEFQMFSPDGHVDALVRQREQRVQVSTATTLTVGVDELGGIIAAEFTASEGRRFNLAAEVLPEWQVMSLASDPSGALESWRVESVDKDLRELQIRLKQGLSLELPLRLIVHVRRTAPVAEQTLNVSDLEVFRFADTERSDELIELRSQQSAHLSVVPAEGVSELDFAELDAARQRLFVEPAISPVYVLGRDSEINIAIEMQEPQFSAEIETQLSINENETIEQTVIHVFPESRAIQRLIVRFSQPARSTRSWTLSGADGERLDVTPLTNQEAERLGMSVGEAVSVVLPEPQFKPFEIWVIQSFESKGKVKLGLVSVQGATEQTGSLVVVATPTMPIELESTRLESEVPSPSQANYLTRTRCSYRYDPRNDFDVVQPVLVTIGTVTEEDSRADLVVWSVRVETTIESSGREMHLARYRLENEGRRLVRFKLPDDCYVNGVWLDGLAIARKVNEGFLEVPLPPTARYVEVLVQLESNNAKLGVTSVRKSVWPRPDAPVMSCESSIKVPESYEVYPVGAAGDELRSSKWSWTERLFGPLARSGTAPFGPTEFDGWLASVSASPTVESNRALDTLLAKLGVAIESTTVAAQVDESSEGATWGELLDAWNAVAKSEEVPLFVDVKALSHAGINAHTPLIDIASAVPRNQTLALLNRSALVLVLHRRTLILTTVPGCSSISDQAETVFGSTVVRDQSRIWDEPIHNATVGIASRFALVPIWKTESTHVWPAVLAGPEFSDEPKQVVSLSSADPRVDARFRLVNKARVRLIGAALFFVVIGVALWRAQKNMAWSVGVTIALVAAALAVPVWLVPIFSSAVLGAIVFWILALFWSSIGHPVERSESDISNHSTAAARALTLLAVVIAFGYAVPSFAQDEPKQAVRKHATPWVFVPVDDERKPSGDRYHVPLDFDRRLREFIALATERPQGWILREISYRAKFSWAAASNRLQLDALSALYDFEVLDALSTVELPLPSGVGISDTISARKNGMTLELPYNPESRRFALPIIRRGSHQMEIPLTAMVEEGSMASGFSMPIPPVPTSRVVLELPADAPLLEVDSALGQVLRNPDLSTIEADLGGSDTLTVSWPTMAMRREMQPTSEVDELVWLRVEPETLLVESQFKLRVTSGSVDKLDLEVDPRLRLLPFKNEKSDVSKAEYLEDEGLIRFHFDPPIRDQATVAASFLLNDASAIGHLNMPQLKAVGTRSRQRLFAVSLAEMFRADRAEGVGFSAVPVADFLAAWGQASSAPNMAYRRTASEFDWSLPIRTADPRVKATENLVVDFQRNRADVELLVDLTSEVGSTFQLEVRAPESLQVDLVSTAVEPLVRRWTRLPSGHIVVFLDGEMTGQQQLRLRGTIPTPSDGDFIIPDIGIVGCETTDRKIEVYRRPAVLVTPLLGGSLPSRTIQAPQGSPSPRRLVAAVGGENLREIPVTIAVNEPQSDVTLVTSLTRDDDTWQATVDCLLEVKHGLVDLLKLNMPADWNKGLQIDPPVPHWIIPGDSERPAMLVIRPHAAIDEQLRLQIKTVLDISSGQRVTVPDLVPVEGQRRRSFVQLPDLAALQRLEWETRGLLPSVFPDSMLGEIVAEQPQLGTVYEVVGSDVQAILRSTSHSGREPHIALATVDVVVHAEDEWYAVAAFDLDPASVSSCPLALPAGCELIRARIGDRPATLQETSQNQWDIMLAASDLPQRIEVVYRPPNRDRWFSASSVDLTAPTLGSITPERIWWTIHVAPGLKANESDPRLEADQAMEFDLVRLNSLETVFLAATEVQVDRPADEMQRWAEPWQRRWEIARQRLEQRLRLSTSSSEDPALQAEINLLDVEHARVLGALNVGTSGNVELLAHGVDSMATDLAEVSSLNEYSVARVFTSKPTMNFELSSNHGMVRGISSGITGVMLAAFAVWWFTNIDRRLRFVRFMRRSALGVVVTAGTLWWLFLSPSWFGPLIVAVGLWYSLRHGRARVASSASLSKRITAYSR